MNCPTCKADNPVSSKFCLECGASFASPCPKCGIELPPAAKFCNGCGAALNEVDSRQSRVKSGEGGRSQLPTLDSRLATSPRSYTPRHLAEKILNSRAALEGERKHVTVLFADVKGSMELAEQVDPEEWHKILDRFFQILTDGVHRFEGTVNQYTGDGIMALFGAPIAHEDHAQRACYAALHLCDELRRYAQELRRIQGLDFAVRMGLNSGEVIVGKIGDDLRMDYTAQGHTVGLAQRMEQLAESGKAYLTEATAALVRGYVTLEDLGEFAVKGLSTPLRVYALEGMRALRTRLDVSRARGFSRLVGRTDEMAALELALKQAVDGRGQVVGIVGEPGVGKSRLCFEFTERCRARGVPVYEAHCPAHGKTLPFLPVLELLRSYFGITDADGDEAARKKIAGTLVLADPAFQEVLPLVCDFLGVPDPERPAPRIDPEARQRQLFAFVRRLLQQRARDAAILLIDDVHWIDPASDAFLAQLADVVPGTHFLLALNFRPEYRAAWMAKSSYQQLPLYPLGAEASQELLADLLGISAAGGRAARRAGGGVEVGGSAGASPSPVEDHDALGELALRIGERTGGNPFFIEEVVQALVEAGRLTGGRGAYRLAAPVDEITIPATVTAVLAARIDRLGEREKAVLQTAAVIGKEFSESVLRSVFTSIESSGASDSLLTDLTKEGARGRSSGARAPSGPPLAGGEEELHASLAALTSAEFLHPQAFYPEAEYAFKHPLTQEVAYRSQLGERRQRVHAAVARATQAGDPEKLDEQAALVAYHWEAAGERLEAAAWSRRAARWTGVGDPMEALRHWRKVRELVSTLPAPSEATDSLALEAITWTLRLAWRTGLPPAEAAALLAEGKDIASRTGDRRALASLLSVYGMIRGFAGEPEEILEGSREAVRLAEEIGDPRLTIGVMSELGITLLAAGRLHELLQLTDRALARVEHDGEPDPTLFGSVSHVWFLWAKAYVLGEMGQLAEARRRLDQVLDLARQHGYAEIQLWARGGLVRHCAAIGEYEEAARHAVVALDTAEKLGNIYARFFAYTWLGVALRLNEDWNQAIDWLARALALARERGTGLHIEGFVLAHLAEARLGRGEEELGRQIAAQAVEIAHRRRLMTDECWARLAQARVLLRTLGAGARAAIEETLLRTQALVEETGARFFLPFIHVERAELGRLLGDEERRRSELRQAQMLFVEMGATGNAERVAKELGG